MYSRWAVMLTRYTNTNSVRVNNEKRDHFYSSIVTRISGNPRAATSRILHFCDSRNYGANYAIQDHFERKDRKIWEKMDCWWIRFISLGIYIYIYIIYFLWSYVVCILLEDLSILVKRDEFSKWIWLWSSYPCFSGLLMDSLCNVWNFF